jgi:SPP1 gp7 family putative phage head morphogenesis protein
VTATLGRIAIDSKAAHKIAATKVRRIASWERTVERQMKAFFGRQERAVLAKLTSRKSQERYYGTSVPERGRRPIQAKAISADSIFDDAAWNAQLRQDAEGWLSAVMDDFGDDTADLLGTSWDLTDKRVAKLLREQVNRVVGVNDTTFSAIADQLAKGQTAGETLDALAARVQGVFETASTSRARMIARTEVVSAANGASHEAALQSGVVSTKTWFAVSDNRTRDDHVEADGQTVDLEDQFDIGGEALDYPGDPAADPAQTVNCRCTCTWGTD